MLDSEAFSATDAICCSRCGQLKPAEAFSWHRRERNQRTSYCRACRSDYHRTHYLANRQRYLDKSAKRKRAVTAERTSFLIRLFEDRPCVDCGEADPVVLEFDHLRDKSFNVSDGLRDKPWSQVTAEIAKCEVRCGNCHRRRTVQSLGWYRGVLLDQAVDLEGDVDA